MACHGLSTRVRGCDWDLACDSFGFLIVLRACSDIVFGNESEAEAFAKANDYGTTDVKEIALKLAAHAKVRKLPAEALGLARWGWRACSSTALELRACLLQRPPV